MHLGLVFSVYLCLIVLLSHVHIHLQNALCYLIVSQRHDDNNSQHSSYQNEKQA